MAADKQDQRSEQLSAALTDQERFRLLVNAVTDYAIYMLDASGHTASWNAGAERFKGYTAPEVIGAGTSRCSIPRRTSRAAFRRPRCRLPSAPASSRPKAGGCARTARASGRM